MQLCALFRLGFPSAPGLLSLNLAACHDSQAHSTKGTPPPFRAATACGSMVSGSLSFPSRGSFHLSLTVLCAIGSCRVFSLGGWSPRIPAGFLVSRRTQVPHHGVQFISHTWLSHSLAGLPKPFRYKLVFSKLHGSSPCGPTTPVNWFGLFRFRSPLLTESPEDRSSS